METASTRETETFTLDGVGNRTAHSPVAGAWRYDANNRLLQRGTTTYEYDEAGNLTKQTEAARVTLYRYDAQQRLVEVAHGTGAVIARYGYDPLHRRLWKEQYRNADGTAPTRTRTL